jgi:hypothetical protein
MLTCKYSSKEGAVLLPGSMTARITLQECTEVTKYCKVNMNSWYQFAHDCGFVVSEGCIVVIRGCDKSTSYASATFWDQTREGSVSLHSELAAEGGVSIKASWKQAKIAQTQCAYELAKQWHRPQGLW